MLYNSFSFLLFFPIAVLLYWLCPDRMRKGLLLVVSYLFYMNWEPVYALLLAGVTLVTFFGAQLMLPIGISFYSFQTTGYLIDVYQKKMRAEKNLLDYAVFSSMFFQLAAGPIGRAPQLLPQVKSIPSLRFSPDDTVNGLKWMLWGYFMKVAVADRLALYTDAVFGNIEHHSGVSMLVAAIFFSIQIYCDFAGYSFIALGVAKGMGIDVIQNFERPYMAQSVGEFWRRWHISLSTWFRDYVYFPLGGNRCSKWRNKWNLMVTFLLSGLMI